ncbi:MAG: hypothetical protein DRQ39_09150, partial [Gammaproteobacteria bacterium]
MAEFSFTEKTNASFKHLFGIQGTSNTDPSLGGKKWYEEKLASSHIIFTEDIWAQDPEIPQATDQATAQAAAT